MSAKEENIPLVSVIVLTYNQKDYIGQTLHSILEQETRFSFEIIIGDDASTDGTSDICAQFASRYPSQVIHLKRDPNMGLLPNYYDAFSRCRGKYVADCGGDDYWIDVHKLQSQVDILEEEPQVIMVHTNWKELHVPQNVIVSDVASRINPHKETRMTGKTAYRKMMRQREHTYVFLCSACYRYAPIREMFDQDNTLFVRPEYFCEDWQLIFMALSRGIIYYLDKETVMYRVAEGTLSRPTSDEKQMMVARSNFMMRIRCAQYVGVDKHDIEEYVQEVFSDFFWFSLRLKKLQPVQEAYQLCQEYGLNIGTKNKFLYRLYTNRYWFAVIYKAYSTLRKIYKRIR